MAATFFVAAPILSAQALSVNTPDPIADINGGSVDAGDTWGAFSVDQLILATAPASPVMWFDQTYGIGTAAAPASTFEAMTDPANGTYTTQPVAQYMSGWEITNVSVYDSTGYNWAPNLGSVNYSGTSLSFTPNPAMADKGDIDVYLEYQMQAIPTALANGTPGLMIPAVSGRIKITVQKPVTSDCPTGYYTAKCLTADIQAYDKKADPTSVKVELLKPNVVVLDAKGNWVSGFVTGNGNWGLAAINSARSNDQMLSDTILKNAITWKIGANSSTVTFTPPKPNWSGTVTYDYTLASYTGPNGTASSTVQSHTGAITFTVHPTLPGIDPIVSDPGAKVTVPVLEQTIIGSKPFSNASCTFADTKSKTTLTGTGTISNKSGSKDPIFTPDAAFTGSVDLVCTVQDTWGITSNSITVTVQVGAVPAPADTTAAPVAPACTTDCGKLVSTGGSLTAPMSSGLAAVVLLVAAGAGILVVRRRTVLAG